MRAPVNAVSPDNRDRVHQQRGMAPAVRLWYLTTGERIRDVTTGAMDSSDLAFSPDGRYLATGSDGVGRRWDVTSLRP